MEWDIPYVDLKLALKNPKILKSQFHVHIYVLFDLSIWLTMFLSVKFIHFPQYILYVLIPWLQLKQVLSLKVKVLQSYFINSYKKHCKLQQSEFDQRSRNSEGHKNSIISEPGLGWSHYRLTSSIVRKEMGENKHKLKLKRTNWIPCEPTRICIQIS